MTKPPASPYKLVGEESESIGVTLKVGDVVPKGRGDPPTKEVAAVFCKEGLDSFLSGVSKGRVAHIVSQTCCLHDGANFFEERTLQLRMFDDEPSGHIVAGLLPKEETSKECVRRLCTKTLPGSGKTCVLF